MRIFHCQCGATVFFENDRCLACTRELGYLPALQTLSAIEASKPDLAWTALAPAAEQGQFRKCQNYAQESVCNWMVPIDDPQPFCVACRLNQTIPNLTRPENRGYWAKIEAAKRRLIYSFLRLKIPFKSKGEDAEGGLAFAFLANPLPTGDAAEPQPKVLTGHEGGLITINIAEADEIEREQVRRQMQETYRTLLGHFRHESGHFCWDHLVSGTPFHEQFRKLFGDEQVDYGEALKRHYQAGAPADWQSRFVSVYASSHPWEDWAETWAHYLHMIDTLETSRAFGLVRNEAADEIIDQHLFGMKEHGRRRGSVVGPFASLLRDWVWLSLSMNSINRSMGMRDAYPFVLSSQVATKLQFVHDVVEGVVTPAQSR